MKDLSLFFLNTIQENELPCLYLSLSFQFNSRKALIAFLEDNFAKTYFDKLVIKLFWLKEQ